MEQERVDKNVFSSEEPLLAASLFAGQKSKSLCVFCKKPHWSDHSHKKRIVWKHGPNWPFYVLMLRAKLY